MSDASSRKNLARTLDIGERIVAACLYAWFFHNLFSDFLSRGHVTSLVLLIGETAVLAFLIIRRPTSAISLNPLDWCLAFTGTMLPLLIQPSANASLIPEALVLVIMIGGGLVQIAAKFVLRRSFGLVAANRGVKMGGPYRIVRHPMYAGYILTQIGFLLANPSAWNLAIYCVAWCAQLGRILAEERVLLQDNAYRTFSARVRYRLIPGLF